MFNTILSSIENEGFPTEEFKEGLHSILYVLGNSKGKRRNSAHSHVTDLLTQFWKLTLTTDLRHSLVNTVGQFQVDIIQKGVDSVYGKEVNEERLERKNYPAKPSWFLPPSSSMHAFVRKMIFHLHGKMQRERDETLSIMASSQFEKVRMQADRIFRVCHLYATLQIRIQICRHQVSIQCFEHVGYLFHNWSEENHF